MDRPAGPGAVVTGPANAGDLCNCGNCRLCAIAAVAHGAAWSDPFGTGRAVADPKPTTKKSAPAARPGLFDDATNSEG